MWFCYNIVKLFHKVLSTHNRHPIAHPWGWDMGWLLWVQKVWSMLYFHRSCYILYNHLMLDNVITRQNCISSVPCPQMPWLLWVARSSAETISTLLPRELTPLVLLCHSNFGGVFCVNQVNSMLADDLATKWALGLNVSNTEWYSVLMSVNGIILMWLNKIKHSYTFMLQAIQLIASGEYL